MQQEAAQQKTPYGTAVLKAGAILKALAGPTPPRTVTEIARATDISKATVYKLLETLQLLGLVERAPLTTYKLGVEVVKLARAYLSEQNGLSAIAEPHLKQLNEWTGETVHLGIRDGNEIVYLAKLESTQIIRMHSSVGQTSPMYCTGLGKAILANLDEAELDSYLATTQLTPFTATTLTTRDALLREIEIIRAQGYAIDNGEHSRDVRCIAIAFRRNRTEWGAISISAPLYRMHDDVLQKYLPKLVEARDAIGRQAQVAY